MELLLTFDSHNYTDDMPVYERHNVRAIIRDQAGRYALQKSRRGDYKLPGGGLDKRESQLIALEREVREECGLLVLPETLCPIGEVLEKRRDIFHPKQIYLCHSYFYACDVSERTVPAAPTGSELRMGYRLVWASLDSVLRENQHFTEPWIMRDTAFLRLIAEKQLCV